MEPDFTPEFLLVKWIDAQESFFHRKPILVWSVGMGIEKENGVVLAQDFFPLEEGDYRGDESFRHTTVIPKSCILEIIHLKQQSGLSP